MCLRSTDHRWTQCRLTARRFDPNLRAFCLFLPVLPQHPEDLRSAEGKTTERKGEVVELEVAKTPTSLMSLYKHTSRRAEGSD